MHSDGTFSPQAASRGSRRPARLTLIAAAFAAGLAGAAWAEPAAASGHKPIQPDEHPRLIFRGADQLKAMRAKAATEWGKAVVYRMHQTRKVMEKASITGRNREVVKEAGFKAAGNAAVFALEGDKPSAERAKRVLLAEVISYPMRSRLPLLDRASRLHGAALAYDLCYHAWDAATRTKAKAFLRQEAGLVLKLAGQARQRAPDTETHVVAYSAVALAELATHSDPDDLDARKRIAACEKAVAEYLDTAVSPRGFGRYGESVKQAAFGTGVVPFLIAGKLVLGRDLTGHAAVRNALTPMVYLAVPRAGMPVIGPKTAAVDRSGLFAMAYDLADPADRPAVAWLFKQIGGDKYRGVVRPHHALYMLAGSLDAASPAAPTGEACGGLYFDKTANVALLRSGWKDADDLVTVVHGGAIRLLGMEGRWVSSAGIHAAIWSDSPGAGALGNVFLFNTRRGRGHSGKTVYAIQVAQKLEQAVGSPGGKAATFTFSSTGLTKRLIDRVKETVKRSQLTKEQLEKIDASSRGKGKSKPSDKVTVETVIGEGGPFRGLRHVAVDYTGRCGAPALVVVSDRMAGGGQAPREWVLHCDVRTRFTMEGPVLSLTRNGVTLRATIVEPRGAAWAGTSNPPVCNFAHLATDNDVVRVALTLGRDAPPKVAVKGRAITVGGQVVRFDGDKPVIAR